MKIAVLSDTHAPRFWKRCPDAVAEQLGDVDLILHAGDVCTPAVLDELSSFAPVLAVQGNNDGADVANWGAPPVIETELAGVRVAMLHDSGAAVGRGERLRGRFPDAALVVFGHSHIPWNVLTAGQLTFNPGSPTDRRRQPRGTMGRLVLADGEIRSAEIVAVTGERPAAGGGRLPS